MIDSRPSKVLYKIDKYDDDPEEAYQCKDTPGHEIVYCNHIEHQYYQTIAR